MPSADQNPDRVAAEWASRAKASQGPLYRAMFDPAATAELFRAPGVRLNSEVQAIADGAVAAIIRHRDTGTLYHGAPLSDAVLRDLGGCGYWGLLLPRESGGAGAKLREYVEVLKRVAVQEPSVANLASVHGCLGAAAVVAAFGSDEQRRRWLPQLASGQRLSAFAMTEPDGGSDLGAMQTTARREGDHYLVSGTKVFITNLAPGRVVALVCIVEGKPAMLIAQLPESDTPECRFLDYGIHAARRSGNRGMVLRDFVVPAANRVDPPSGNGLSIAYYGLNRGRMSLCATAGGVLRRLLAGLLPWVGSRRTFGRVIGEWPLVQRRVGRLGSLIVGCDTLAAWCAHLLDNGYRGETECMTAKIFAADSLREAAIDLVLRTHGGRSFLVGNPIGDALHDLLAPLIYEGENELLSLGLAAAIVKARAGNECLPTADRGRPHREADEKPTRPYLQRLGSKLDRRLAKFGREALADQHWTLRFALQVQAAATLACLAPFREQQTAAVTRLSCDAISAKLKRRLNKRLSLAEVFQQEVAVGRLIIEQGWQELDDVPVESPTGFDCGDGLATTAPRR